MIDLASTFSAPEIKTGSPEISMAPLIDVVFQLLIFFMVATVFPDARGLVIEKPVSEHSLGLERESIVLTLDQLGNVSSGGKPLTPDQIPGFLKNELAARPKASVILRADRRSTTEALVALADAAKAGGAATLGIATDEAAR